LTGQWQTRLSRLTLGIGLIAVSVLALAASLTAGTWSLQFLSLFPLVAGVVDLYATVTNPQLRTHPISYATGALGIAAALLLLISPSLAVNGVVVLLLGFLVLDGVLRLGQAVLGAASNTPRTVSVVNGASSLCLALAGWAIWQTIGAATTIGVAVAGYTAAAGWRLLASPSPGHEDVGTLEATNVHPDGKLGLGEHELFGTISARRSESSPNLWQIETYWLLVIGLVLFATHLGRMQSADTWLGLISPFVATAGDVFLATALGALLVLPLRLGWRRLTRPIERKAWQLRLSEQDAHMEALPRRFVQAWTDARFAFSASLRAARASLASAGAFAVHLGLPLAVLFAAINPIWGFNWYFNTESWASGFYEKITELRVDTWRASMVDAIKSAYGDKSNRLFQMTPAGIDDGDFSFIVIGDPGEGDGSQYSLVENYLELGRREDIKFLVISSDVIYPAGAMSDYEQNFYLPFKGFTKPIYAFPGNHDWFDALEGFNANFLEPKAARVALSARADADFNLTSTDKSRIDSLLQRAQRLRELYGIQNAQQRAPFFELQTKDFALIAIDTGIRRTIDDRQLAWIKDVLERSRGKFTMAIVGHPKYAGGQDTSKDDKDFAALYALLEQAGVQVMMAGDTHAFEYYLEEPNTDQNRRPIPYFVNGGGGAYLSIGGALAWPEVAPTKEWAFYPGPEAVYAKLDAETPDWKQPFWMWVKRFGAWPLSIEALSSMFDFNHAPFYQSFMEVRVERSKNRVVFALHGVNGPVHWRDLDTSPSSGLNAKPDGAVEFVVEMTTPTG
jgi:hypothetical protein